MSFVWLERRTTTKLLNMTKRKFTYWLKKASIVFSRTSYGSSGREEEVIYLKDNKHYIVTYRSGEPIPSKEDDYTPVRVKRVSRPGGASAWVQVE